MFRYDYHIALTSSGLMVLPGLTWMFTGGPAWNFDPHPSGTTPNAPRYDQQESSYDQPAYNAALHAVGRFFQSQEVSPGGT